MRFYKNLSIRGKIMSAVLLIVALELMLAAGSLYFLTTINANTSQIVDVDAEKRKLAGKIRTGLLEVHRAQKNALLFDSRELVEREIARKNRYNVEIRAALTDIDRFIDPQERANLREMHVLLVEFAGIDNRIENMVLERLNAVSNEATQAAAVALSSGSGRAAYNRLAELIDGIVHSAEADMADHRQSSIEYFNTALVVLLGLCAASIIGGLLAGVLSARIISDNLGQVAAATDAIAGGDLQVRVAVDSGDETGRLASSVQQMQTALQKAVLESEARDFVKTGVTRINDAMRGRVQLTDLCASVIAEMASYLSARVGAVFLLNGGGNEPVLEFAAGYAYENKGQCPDCFRIGEGLVGQAALNKAPIRVHDLPADYVKVCSGLGDSCPTCITIAPLIFEDHANGVVELAFFQPPTDVQLDYLQQVLPAVAVTIETVRGREHLARSLAQAQVLTEELQQQQDELRAVNEELEEQTRRLKHSEETLRRQQEELETANTELEEKNSYLENSRAMIERSNRDLAESRIEIEEKAEQLALASRYKSEFLANMSHELRTPLNSILLLARMLADNKEGNLNEKQMRSANIIHSSGNDLLVLINEVLDLARIEAGRLELRPEQIDLRRIAEGVLDQFGPIAEERGLKFDVGVDEKCPQQVSTDPKRLNQILRNLVSNAIKFTDKGDIAVRVARPAAQETLPHGLHRNTTVSIAIRDTGIGIAPEQQQSVFEAFQQLDHGATRRFPGTGLGLSISRELAHLMGGEILLSSQPGKGSTFTLYLPDALPQTSEKSAPLDEPAPPTRAPHRQAAATLPAELPQAIPDDRENLAESDPTILVIEDDAAFAQSLMDLCRDKGCKVLFAPNGEQGLALAETHQPKGIFLDIRLPGRDGWSVLESIKASPRLRHIPVHILSVENDLKTALERGAIGFLSKPVDKEDLESALAKLENVFNRPMKELLVVEDDATLRQGIIALIGNGDVRSDEAGSGAEALQAIRSKRYDCMILDLGLPDMNGMELLRIFEKEAGEVLPPVIVYTGRELTHEQESELRRYSESIIVKGVCSQERLLDEASLFLHRMVNKMPAAKRRVITDLHDCDLIFREKKILIVDDDMRNVFALSKLLEEKGVITFKAENGRKALELLETTAEIDLVLMDMMMPVMDGYEAMQRIRAGQRFRNLPLIALTAKAMPQDRARCIQAGASDYLSKPVDMTRLFSILRVWLYR
jgi:CheY-like chemotaxis protein/signal transduction histidine kinase